MQSQFTPFILPNGLTVIYLPRPESKTVSLSLRVIAGSIYESTKEIGIAHFLEHIVSDGTKNYPTKKQLTNLIDEKGGFRNASTNKETIEYVVKVLPEDINAAFEYISEITMHPLIRETDVIKQKNIIEQEIYRFKSDPEKFSQRLIYSVLYPETRSGGLNTGDIEDIKNISQSAILSYHNKTHTAQNMILAVCGNITSEKVHELATKYFGKIKSGLKIPRLNINVLPKAEHLIRVQPSLQQTTLTLGYQGVTMENPEHYSEELLSLILTRGKSSRLYLDIREKHALAYSVNGNNLNGRNIGIFTIRIGLAPEKLSKCLDIIKTELKNITKELVSDAELKRVLSYIKSNIAFSFENTLTEASYYSNMWCETGNIHSIETELLNYELAAKDPEKLKLVASRLFLPIQLS